MSSIQPYMDSISSPEDDRLATISSPNFNEDTWIIDIRKTLDEEEPKEAFDAHLSIFSVPKSIMSSDPNSYTPQHVAIGPYHCLRPEVYDMEKYKLAAAKRYQKELPGHKLKQFVDQLIEFELKIRGSYNKSLSFNRQTLAWRMAVDASFLLEVLQICDINGAKVLTKTPSTISKFVSIASNKMVFNATLRDVMMLENQIPLFVIREMLKLQFSSSEKADEKLGPMLVVLREELSPFKVVLNLDKIDFNKCAHLLDFLYQSVVPEITEDEELDKRKLDDENSSTKRNHVMRLLVAVWRILYGAGKAAIGKMKLITHSKAFKGVIKLLMALVSKVLEMFIGPTGDILETDNRENDEGRKDHSTKTNTDKPPLMEEIAIPSVTDLYEAGVQFVPTNGGINSIAFDFNTLTLNLPNINLDVNSEVILRNLVAYEACSKSGPLVLARYTELMNGIIDTDEDARLLRERGIITNRLKSDQEVANLWNGMNRSVRLTKVSFLDEVIEDVNKFYSERWKVKFGKFMKKYVFGSWRFLTFLAGIVFIVLMGLQAFCQAYTCSRVWGSKP